MKTNTIIPVICLLFVCLYTSCSNKSSGGGGGVPPPSEENLVIGIDPDLGSAVAPSLGATYNFTTIIKSKMPVGGINIDVVCTKDADNSSVSSQTVSSSSTPVSVSVSNLLPGVLCTVKITVTSKSKPTNTASLSFKVARK